VFQKNIQIKILFIVKSEEKFFFLAPAPKGFFDSPSGAGVEKENPKQLLRVLL